MKLYLLCITDFPSLFVFENPYQKSVFDHRDRFIVELITPDQREDRGGSQTDPRGF